MNKNTLKATLSVALLFSVTAMNALSTQAFKNLDYQGVSTVESRNYYLGKAKDTTARCAVTCKETFNNVCNAGSQKCNAAKNYVNAKINAPTPAVNADYTNEMKRLHKAADQGFWYNWFVTPAKHYVYKADQLIKANPTKAKVAAVAVLAPIVIYGAYKLYQAIPETDADIQEEVDDAYTAGLVVSTLV